MLGLWLARALQSGLPSLLAELWCLIPRWEWMCHILHGKLTWVEVSIRSPCKCFTEKTSVSVLNSLKLPCVYTLHGFFFLCAKNLHREKSFFELLIGHDYFSANVMLWKKPNPFIFWIGVHFSELSQQILNFRTVMERFTQLQWLCVLGTIIKIMSFICYAFVWKDLHYCRSEQKLE